MKQKYILLLGLFFNVLISAQNEYHVFSKDDKSTSGTVLGNGSLQNPWDLQTALNQPTNSINGGDIIWLHEGIYNGRFISRLKSTIKDKFITVSSFKKDQVILNGNIKSNGKAVLTVKGNNVIYKNFEVTWLGDFSRKVTDSNFQKSAGVSHDSGINCKFINIKIYNIPGSGFGSWKRTGGTTINGCIIYNNGYMSKKRGSGVGIYVQNESDKIRLISNNIIFNNYYKGVEVWSDNGNATSQYVKNVTLKNNIIFNNGLPSGVFRDNLIIATNDKNGINIAKNITINNNIFYHNTNLSKEIENNEASSLTLGFNKNAPVENIKVHNNIIIGRKNALRVLHAKSLSFSGNVVYSGYARFRKSVLNYINPKTWKFNNNTYYTRKNKPIRIQGFEDYTIKQWKDKYGLDENSNWKSFKNFNVNNILDISQNEYNPSSFRVVLFNKEGQDVSVNFSEYGIRKGIEYKIYDVENRKAILKEGKLEESSIVLFPMNSLELEKPMHNTKAKKTLNNFGVFVIEFEETKPKKRKGFFGRLFD